MKKILVGLFFTLSILATCWSLLHPTFFRVHDFVHAARIVEMLRGLNDGQFPVRWSANFGFGYGMPLYEFYAPLPYFVGAGLMWLGMDVVTAIKILYIITAVGAWWGMYKLGSSLFGRASGILAAVAFTLAPYRALNLYVRGALSESWAIMFFPWILFGLRMVGLF